MFLFIRRGKSFLFCIVNHTKKKTLLSENNEKSFQFRDSFHYSLLIRIKNSDFLTYM